MTDSLYERDLAAWIHQQIDYLKTGQYEKIDLEKFIEEVEGVVKIEKRAIKNYFVSLLGHILRIEYRNIKKDKSWYFYVDHARESIRDIITDSPSLNNYLQFAFEQSWTLARKLAISDHDFSHKDVPVSCPYDLDYVMNKRFDFF